MSKKQQMPAALKLREARAYLGGLSVPTIHRLVRRGLLRPNKFTRHLNLSHRGTRQVSS
jgi:hypothetical protein